MSDVSTLRNLFDRWERVWHEGAFNFVSECVGPNYIRHDEAGDRTVTARSMQQRSPKSEKSDRIYASWSTITHSRVTARGFALHLNGLMQRPARHTARRDAVLPYRSWQAC